MWLASLGQLLLHQHATVNAQLVNQVLFLAMNYFWKHYSSAAAFSFPHRMVRLRVRSIQRAKRSAQSPAIPAIIWKARKGSTHVSWATGTQLWRSPNALIATQKMSDITFNSQIRRTWIFLLANFGEAILSKLSTARCTDFPENATTNFSVTALRLRFRWTWIFQGKYFFSIISF